MKLPFILIVIRAMPICLQRRLYAGFAGPISRVTDMSYGAWLVPQGSDTVRCIAMWRKLFVENGMMSARRKESLHIDDQIYEDLVGRFEKPDRRNRWDSPLFELCPSDEGIEKSSAAILDAVDYLKRCSKSRDVKVFQLTIATQNTRFSEANSLSELERATHEVINAVVEAQSKALGGPLNGISLGQDLPNINISRSVGQPELRRLRRTFIKQTGQTSLSGPPPPSDADSAQRMFVDYLNRELETTLSLMDGDVFAVAASYLERLWVDHSFEYPSRLCLRLELKWLCTNKRWKRFCF